jgi:hypothetical protein
VAIPFKQLGIVRLFQKKGLKSFGCVLNIACVCPTGLFVSGSMSQFDDTATNGVKENLQGSLSVETTEEEQMHGKMLHGDRGYNDDKLLCFCNKINAAVFFTVKRGPTRPFVIGATNYKRNRDQLTIPENVGPTAIIGVRDIDGKILYLTE